MNASRGVDTSSPGLTKSQRELIAFLSEGHTSPAADRVNRWIACSPRYAAFVEQYKHKIRKKLRVTREPEAAADLLYELQPGAHLGWEITELRDELSRLFARPVDLVSRRSIHPMLREAVLREAKALHAA